ncbi:MAG: HAD-IA family hydrolase, partial [Bacillota bacterium]
PAPDIFLKAAALLKVEPSDCLVIEDSHHGVKAAKAAGMKCLGFRNPNSGNQDIGVADLVVDHLTGLSIRDLQDLF